MVGYGRKLAPLISNALAMDATIVGEPTAPNRFSDFDLLEREASYGRSGFALQFMLDTRLSDAERYPLKVYGNHHGYTHSGSPREGLMVI